MIRIDSLRSWSSNISMRLRLMACLGLLLGTLAPSTFAQVKDTKPEYPNVEIQVTFLKPGDLKSFTADATIAAGAQASFRCGRIGGVSDISWSFMERSEFGDIYKFTRFFPQGKDRQNSQREVLYMGRETLIWQDEDQRVTIKPRPPAEP
jgi:hypothetical protein